MADAPRLPILPPEPEIPSGGVIQFFQYPPPPPVRPSRFRRFFSVLGWLLFLVTGATAVGLYFLGKLQIEPLRAPWGRPKYEASCVLFIDTSPPVWPAGSPRYLSGSPISQAPPDVQAALVKSRLVLTSTLKSPKVASTQILQDKLDPEEWLQENLQTDFSMGPHLLRVSLKGNDPDEIDTLLSGVMDAYLNEVVLKERNKWKARVDQLLMIASTYQDKLNERRQELRQLILTVGTADNVPPKDALQLESLKEDVARIQAIADKAKYEAKVMEGELQSLPRTGLLEQVIVRKLK